MAWPKRPRKGKSSAKTRRSPAAGTEALIVRISGSRSTRPSPNRGRKFPPEILAPEEVLALMRGCSPRAPTGIRNRALITVLYRGGLRIGETLALRVKDLDPTHGTLRILHGKGDKARTVGLDPEAFAQVQRWVDRRRARGLNPRAPLFCSLRGRALTQTYVRALLPRLARKAAIDKRVHPHGFRHTHAAELMAEGVPVNVIQAQLGHTDLATTSRYLQHIAPTQVIDTMKAREWDTSALKPARAGARRA